MYYSEKLEFSKILTHISKYCFTQTGKELVKELKPLLSETEILLEGKYVSEAKELINERGYPPISALNEIQRDIHLSRIDGSILSAKAVFNIFELAICSTNLKSYLSQNRDISPLLSEFSTFLFEDKLFERYISSIFDPSGEVKDTASKSLQSIRREIRDRSDELRRYVTKIVKDLTEKEVTRDNYLTLRDGRLVVPVKVEYKRQLKGIIHSESSTGQTVYIEPEETLHLNNEIVSLGFAEKREIERILKEVTLRIRHSSDELLLAYETVTKLDSIFARANYSIEVIGTFPAFDENEEICIYGGRHPLLIQKHGIKGTVPFNLRVKPGNSVIITGPNAGGKTVLIKSIGLLILMAQSGIHIPAGPDTNLHLFNKILVDIGDSQSIDDDLSTFSSHLSNIKNILQIADERTLVLIDEIGTGTDPDSGAAISRSILLELNKKGSLVFSTTHLSALKALASGFDGFNNASMSFDTVELKPTYIFKQGIPGSSYAFEILLRLGFEKEFIDLSTGFVQDVNAGLEKVLLEVEQREQELMKKLSHFEKENTRLTGLANLYEKKVRELDKEKNKILREAKEKAAVFIEESNKEIQKVIKEIKETQASKATTTNAIGTISELKSKLSKIKSEEKPDLEKEESVIEIGDTVKIRDSETAGEVIEITPDKKHVVISTGPLKISFSIDLCVKVSKKDLRKEKRKASNIEIKSDVSYRLDIRGERAIEVENRVERFLIDAYLANLGRCEIVHGKGTGALKKVVHDMLKLNPKVKNYHFASVDAGGEGVTIVEFTE
ncbi:endonuclease MutS2 [Ignavibacteriales bacterium]